ncbi:MAG TPA: GNAT family N-acetyltransferase [Casimicrobiaceae bacterium]|nr:GNAT family N-acetyltransferase [Casimicrobiaceae bacterium]
MNRVSGRMTAVVRPITLGDIAGMRDCVGAVASEGRYLAVTQPFTLQETALFVARNVEGGYPQYVADDDGRIVGWCDITPKRGNVHAHVGELGMGLLQGFRGHGLGSKLISAALEAARARWEQVELSVYASNTQAAALYRKFGFVECGRFERGRKHDGAYDDVILMARCFDAR